MERKRTDQDSRIECRHTRVTTYPIFPPISVPFLGNPTEQNVKTYSVCDHCGKVVAGEAPKLTVLKNEKYHFYIQHHVLRCDRYGEPWRDFIGDNAVHTLADRILELEGRL